MPILGFGVFQIPPDDTEQAVSDALEVGYRHIDTAAVYGTRTPSAAPSRSSGIPRDELFITTKLWIQKPGEANAKAAFEQLARAARPRLRRPVPDPPAAGRLLQLLAGDGAAQRRRPGPGDRRLELLSRPARRSHRELRGHPGGQPDRDAPVLPARRRSAAHGRARRADRVLGPIRRGQERPVHQPVAAAIGEAHGKSVAQVVLRWLTQRNVVAIPKSVRSSA